MSTRIDGTKRVDTTYLGAENGLKDWFSRARLPGVPLVLGSDSTCPAARAMVERV